MVGWIIDVVVFLALAWAFIPDFINTFRGKKVVTKIECIVETAIALFFLAVCAARLYWGEEWDILIVWGLYWILLAIADFRAYRRQKGENPRYPI